MLEEENILHGPPEVETEFKNVSLGQLLLNQLTVHGTQVAQINAYTGKEQTYEEILCGSKGLAIALRNAGLKENECVAVCSENNIDFCIPVCAALYLGATVCPINPLYTEGELLHALNLSKPKYIFASSISVNNVKKIISRLSWLPEVVTLTGTENINFPSMENLMSNIPVENNFHACSVDVDNHIAAILCSSGTTGLPKGVMLTDRNILTVIKHLMHLSSTTLSKDTTTLALLPFFHVYSFALLLVRLIFGSRSVVLSRFDEHVFLQTIEKYKIEVLNVVPPIMVFFAKHPLVDQYDLTSVKEIWCGAAPLSENVQKVVATRLNVPLIKQGYGLTETTLAVLKSPEGVTKYGSVGTLAPGISAKVIPIGRSPTARALGPNCTGELCFKGDLIMKGYYNDQNSTMATIDKDGWLHSGDIGYYDEMGYFYIVDRLKELIKYKGYQVPPAELEAVLLTCPG
ncbi:hypothetical protein KM043_000579 [Ampulex compressa]|nr:hypothetical protein KM043_000579 [Ampulex compressa]